MFSSGSMDKWMQHELRKVNRGIVSRKKKLSALLKEANPQCTTLEGEPYLFDVDALRHLASVLKEGENPDLPITIQFSTVAEDSCYVADERTADILRGLENFGDAYPYRDGKMWMPNSLAYSLVQKYPTLIQALFL